MAIHDVVQQSPLSHSKTSPSLQIKTPVLIKQFLSIFYKWNHRIRDFLCLASFTECPVCDVQPCCSIDRCCFLFLVFEPIVYIDDIRPPPIDPLMKISAVFLHDDSAEHASTLEHLFSILLGAYLGVELQVIWQLYVELSEPPPNCFPQQRNHYIPASNVQRF